MTARQGLMLGSGLLIAASVVGAIVEPVIFLRAYLWAYLFWLGLALGSLGLVMLHHLSGGGWGFVVRRIGEAAAMTLPLLAALFVPILLGASRLFPWMNAQTVAADPALQHRAGAYTLFWFTIRAVFYFAVWIGCALVMRRWSLAQDAPEPNDPLVYTRRFQKFSGMGLALTLLCISLASIDWIMSLEPHWYSTIFGMLVIVSQGLTAFAFAALVVARLARGKNPLAENLGAQNFHDLGNLIFTFLLLWAYMAFSQFLISWSGNESYEATWYVHRQAGGWWYVATLMIVTHFFVPFALLLFGGLKKRPRYLGMIAAFVLLARLLESYWFVTPAFYHDGLHFNWLDLALPLAIGGLFLLAWEHHLRNAPLLPLRDPRLLLVPNEETK